MRVPCDFRTVQYLDSGGGYTGDKIVLKFKVIRTDECRQNWET